MTDYEKKIERGLILFLRERKNIIAETAYMGESEAESGWGGCDTCGYGGSDGNIETPIYYRRSGEFATRTVYIDGTSIDFLPRLLDYIDRAN